MLRKILISTFFLLCFSCSLCFATEYKFNYDELCKTEDLNRIVTACKTHSDNFYYLVFAVTHEESYKCPYKDHTIWHTYLLPKHDFVVDDLKFDGYAYKLRLKIARGYISSSGGIDRIDSICSKNSSQYLGYSKQIFEEYLTSKKIVDLSFPQRILTSNVLNEKNSNSFSLVATNCDKLKKILKPFKEFDNGDSDSDSDNDSDSDSDSNGKCECPKFLEPLLKNVVEINKKITTIIEEKKKESSNKEIIKILDILQNNISKDLKSVSSTISSIAKSFADFQKDFKEHSKNFMDYFNFCKDSFNKLDNRLEEMQKLMMMMDHDDDHPDLFSINTTNQEILNFLRNHMKDINVNIHSDSSGGSGSGGSGGSGGSSGSGSGSGNLDYSNELRNIFDMTSAINKQIADGLNVHFNNKDKNDNKCECPKFLKEIIAKLDEIIKLLKKLIGNQEDLEKSIKNMEDAFKNLMLKHPLILQNADTRSNFDDVSKNFNSNVKLKKLTCNYGFGETTFFDIAAWAELAHLIREILEAILWISLFIYFVRVFIPKLKI